ncbi:uncharacterized protein LOC126834150 isoform X1 [Adelges cooleyi]|uniref:uncharacterized protein LOC126834150 isoform X1 n=1 Tax=Adelges cooleyi TaxID=133065 RepID=UPI00217F237F|nr:uncharacterized protein LOC126834150 isoform X1 [Adelges cooleyi]
MNAKYLIILCLTIINHRTAKTADNPEMKEIQAVEITNLYQKLVNLNPGISKYNIIKWLEAKIGEGEGEPVELTQLSFIGFMERLGFNIEVLRKLNNQASSSTRAPDWSNVQKAIEIKETRDMLRKQDIVNLTQQLQKHKDEIGQWIETAIDKGLVTLVYDEFGTKINLSDSNFHDLMESLNLSLEELRDLNKRLANETTPINIKAVEITNLYQKLLNLNPGTSKDKIIEWLRAKMRKSEGETVELTELSFIGFMERLDINIEVLRKLNNQASSSTRAPDWSNVQKAIEIKETQDMLRNLHIVNLTQQLLSRKDEIQQWIETAIDKGLVTRVYDEFGAKVDLSDSNFHDLMESLNLSLEELRDLNIRLANETSPINI